MAAIFVGGIIPDIAIGDRFFINLGGAVFAHTDYIYEAGTARKEQVHLGPITAAAVYFAADSAAEPKPCPLINYVYGILAGISLFIRPFPEASYCGYYGCYSG